MKEPIISIIVPVYNVEKYLNKCIDSIIAQTFHNWELILIDDGSTDRSGKICDEYSSLNKNIKTIHIENSGASAARNKGLEYVNGQYIAFVDSDDWIDNEHLEKIYYSATNDNADITWFGLKYCQGELISNSLNKPSILNDKKVLLHEMFTRVHAGVVLKIFRRDLIENNNIRFPQENYYEDMVFSVNAILKSQINTFCPISSYNYRMVETSMTNSFTFSKRLQYLKDCIANMQRILSLLNSSHYQDLFPDIYRIVNMNRIRTLNCCKFWELNKIKITMSQYPEALDYFQGNRFEHLISIGHQQKNSLYISLYLILNIIYPIMSKYKHKVLDLLTKHK